MAGPGGRIPPDGRPANAPGIGKTSRRHDLEAQPTPGLSGSDLQYGDVQRLEQAQQIAPRRTQDPARPGGGPKNPGPRPAGGGPGAPFQAPDPVQFAKDKLSNTLTGDHAASGAEFVDVGPWIPLLRAMANAPRSSGALRNVMVETLSSLVQSPVMSHSLVIDMDALDDGLEEFANGLSR